MNSYKFLGISILVLVSSLLYSQTTCELFLEDGKLSGDCENTYIIKAFEIELSRTQLDSTTLFDELPLIGKFTVDEKVYDARYASTESEDFNKVSYELTNRSGFPQILIKTRLGSFTMDQLVINSNSISFSINLQPTPPVSDTDLQIIGKVKKLLKSEKEWHKNDDRDCSDDIDNGRYSLFCALKTASIEVEGEYNHRNAIMQKVRIHINNRYPDKVFAHRLRDYNNMEETTYDKLIDLLDAVENEVILELANRQ